MLEPIKSPFDAMLDAFRQVVREELAALGTRPKELLTPEELAEKLGLKNHKGELLISWVYEQSRPAKANKLKNVIQANASPLSKSILSVT
jgi:hypothetical protein